MMKKSTKLLLACVFVVVLLALSSYFLNSLNTFTSLGPRTNCTAGGAFYCRNASINARGQVSLVIAQNTGTDMYEVALSCVLTEKALPSCVTYGLCKYNDSFYPENRTFDSSSFGIGDLLRNSNGTLSIVSVKNLSCYTSDGQILELGSAPLGSIQLLKTNYTALYVWLRYAASNSAKNLTYLPGAFVLHFNATSKP